MTVENTNKLTLETAALDASKAKANELDETDLDTINGGCFDFPRHRPFPCFPRPICPPRLWAGLRR